jgi:hypothetical protein
MFCNSRITSILLNNFSGWNVAAIKFYFNMVAGNMDKEVTIRINNLFCDFEETIEFIHEIFSIRGEINIQRSNSNTKSLGMPFNQFNVQMLIIIQETLSIWEQSDNKIPKYKEYGWNDSRTFKEGNFNWGLKIRLDYKETGGGKLKNGNILVKWKTLK